MTTILAWIALILATLNALQLPAMAAFEFVWCFINRVKYVRLGEALFVAKHSLWATMEDDDDDLWFDWLFFDVVGSFVGFILWLILLSTGYLWYIVAILAALFGARFIIDLTKDKTND